MYWPQRILGRPKECRAHLSRQVNKFVCVLPREGNARGSAEKNTREREILSFKRKMKGIVFAEKEILSLQGIKGGNKCKERNANTQTALLQKEFLETFSFN